MWKITLMLCAVICVFSCSSPGTETSSGAGNVEAETPVETKDLLKEYESYIASLDSTNERSVSLAAEKYAELFSGSDDELCDSAFVLFHALYEKVESGLNGSVFSEPDFDELSCAMYDEDGKELPMDKRLAAIEKRMQKHGFRLECWEGYPGIAGERAFIASHFYKYVSPVMKEFLEGLRRERDSELSIDAGISIPEEEYVDRLVWWEKFNRTNPDFILSKKARSNQIYLFTYSLTGMDNTPAINYSVDENGAEKMELDAYFVKAYAYLNKKYPASPINALVKPYAAAIQKNDQVKRDKLIKTYTRQGLMIDFSKDFDLDL